MASILQGELAQEVADALDAANVPYVITISRTTVIPPENEWEEPVETTINYDGRGWVDQYGQDLIDGTLITSSDRRVMIITGSLAITPTTTDLIVVSGKSYSIANVKTDPAGALWDLQARA